MDTIWLAFFPPFFQGLMVALGTGLVLGLEREHQQSTEQYSFAGLRTFALMSLVGYLTGNLAIKTANTWLIPLVAVGILLLIAMAYRAQAEQKSLGLTTEIALFISYLSGSLVAVGYPGEAFGGAVAVAVLLSLKTRFRHFIQQISQEELAAFLKFFVLIVLALLLLPDAYFGPDNLLHYRSVGWVILLVSSISLTGYLLLKFGSARYGILGTAAVGGLFSSTLVAWVFSGRSRQMPSLAPLFSGGILLSSSVMYLRVLFLTSLFSIELTRQLLLPCVLMFLVSVLVVGFLYAPKSDSPFESATPSLPLGNPLDLKNALYFAALYVGVSFFMYYSRQELGESGSFASAAFSGIADMDAITISTAQWVQQSLSYGYAARVIVIGALSNTVFKAILVLVRSCPSTRKQVLIGFGLVWLMGGLWLALRWDVHN